MTSHKVRNLSFGKKSRVRRGVSIVMGVLGIAALVFFTPPCAAPAKNKKAPKREWTVEQTISAALDYSPALKARAEEAEAARQDVKMAKSGYLPRLDVEGRTGFGSLPVAKDD